MKDSMLLLALKRIDDGHVEGNMFLFILLSMWFISGCFLPFHEVYFTLFNLSTRLFLYSQTEIWDGRRADPDVAVDYFGAHEAYPVEDIGNVL